jgi:itaconyl-CoA hydratase
LEELFEKSGKNMKTVSGYEGLLFEDLKKGDKIVHRLGKTVTYQDNLLFTHLLLNTAPLHFDNEYMQLTEFKKPLLVMTMTYAVVIGIASIDFKNVVEEVEIRNLKMHSPVFDGDTIHVETEVLDKFEDKENEKLGIVVLRHKGYKDNFKQIVIEFERVVKIFKRKYFPRYIHKTQSFK